MSLTTGGVTIDCADPRALSEFWTAALGYEITADFDDFLFLGPIGSELGAAEYLGLQRVPEERAGKNRVHIDFHADDRSAEVERLVSLGAAVAGEHSVPGYAWSVLSDPEGNVFCVGAPISEA